MSTEVYNGTPQGLAADEAGQVQEIIARMIAGVRTAQVVRVVSVTNSGDASPIGYVSIQPLVGQLDGRGKHVDHGVIYNVPYLRIQGGQNAVILDPAVGDIGVSVFCDRDISGVKSGKRAAPPPSARKHDMSDAVYLHSIISVAPSQYIAFQAGGIVIKSPGSVKIQADSVTIDSPSIRVNGETSINGDVSIIGGNMTHNGTNVGSSHVHGGVKAGMETTSTPQ